MLKNIGFKILLVIMSVFFISGYSLAEKGVFNAKISPNETFTDTSTIVKMTAEIASENLYISSVMAYQTDSDGRPINRIGQMYDDGTHGDENPADTIFTIEFDVEDTSASITHFVVTAAYDRDRNRYISPTLDFTIYEPLPIGIVDDTVATVKDLEILFDSYLVTNDYLTARQMILENALNDSNISHAYLSGEFLIIIFEDLVKGLVRLTDPNLPPSDADVSSILPEDIRYSGNSKLLIFAPGYDDASPQDKIADHAKSQFGNSALFETDPNPPVITKNTNASLDVVKQWADYGTIIIHTHGAFDSGVTPKQVVFKSGTEATSANQTKYAADIKARRIGVSSGEYYFYPSFITQHVGSMKNTFLYLGACMSLHNLSMWDALRARGAKVAFGWNQTVYRAFNTAKFKELIDPMLPPDANDDPQTAKQAFDAITDKDDTHPTPAVLTMKVSDPKWENFVFGESGLINGDFELGDLTGWSNGGENGQTWQKVLGAHVHNGNFAGSLGRWDTAYHGEDPTAEPAGYEWIYQDFTVPNNITKLKFHWWMETYDTARWDWFDAYIKDTNGNTLITILSNAGKPGSDFGPYWNTQMADGGNGWREVSVDISAYRGQTIRIYFDQRLDGYGDQQRVYVDDVILE